MADRLPLTGVSVLLTRAAEDNAPLGDRLRKRGARVHELPTIVIKPPEDPAALDAALRDLPTYDWIIFTSRNAVHAVFHRLTAIGLTSTFPHVAAVGPATAETLASHGRAVDCVPEEATGAALAEALQRCGVKGQRVLLPAGDRARPDLARALADVGAEVQTVIAYRTVDAPAEGATASTLADLWQGHMDVVALASPSAFAGLTRLLGGEVDCLRHVRLVCIGPITASAVRVAGFEPAAVAAEHTAEGLADAIARLYEERS